MKSKIAVLLGVAATEANGSFALKKGTGAYGWLHGTGTINTTLDFSSGFITAVYAGKAHVDGG